MKESKVLKGSAANMTKRRFRVVDKPDRGRGWSNGRFTTARDSSDAADTAHCPECDRETPHEWDDCTICKAEAEKAKAKPKRRRRRRRGKKK